MTNLSDIFVSPSDSILTVMGVIDKGAMQIALMVDEEDRLLGTLTDGDIRRALLRGVPLDDSVSAIANKNPTVVRVEESLDAVMTVMKLKRLRHIPVVDNTGKIVAIKSWDDISNQDERDNWVVIMAGGLGSRLRPMTDECPKPLLKIGDKPLLETIIKNFVEHGFHKFYLSVNYKADMIEEYFGDGSRMGIEIRYIREAERMGTAGSLSLLEEKPKSPLIVMNGDLLTKVDFTGLLSFHMEQRAIATMCVRSYAYQIPYGVVLTKDQKLIEIREKPYEKYFVNAGIYVLDPDVLGLIPTGQFFDMPQLFTRLKELELEAVVFPIREYWTDIGRLEDFQRANVDYPEVFG